jgi:H+-translocating NAD(P) transhydrogenase subunit alpha
VTTVVLASIYLLALSVFLGLDIISKVPPTLYGVVLAGLGTLSAVSLAGALHLAVRSGAATPDPLSLVAIALAGASAGGGLMAMGRLLRAFGSNAQRKTS